MHEFHIHVDAWKWSDQLDRYLVGELGFAVTDFAGLEGGDGYEPPHHLTFKVDDSNQFRRVFKNATAYVEEHNSLKGYIEGEFLAVDQHIKLRTFDPSVTIPFRLQMGKLPAGKFRESEIHITLSRDQSDPRLLSSLSEMGLFTAYLAKPYGIAQIFTVQGSRKNIEKILPVLRRFLLTAGGAVECSIKEERITDWWMSELHLLLPPVVTAIESGKH